MKAWPGLLMSLLLLAPALVDAVPPADESGRQMMLRSVQQHQYYPYVFEQQTMILIDADGYRDVRAARRFSRLEDDGTSRFLLVFDQPEEVRGVALLAQQHAGQATESDIYLPAFGQHLIRNENSHATEHFLGSDFSLQQLLPEELSDYRYQRQSDYYIGKTAYYRIQAEPLNPSIEARDGYARRELLLRQDNLFVIQTDYFDRRNRLLKRFSAHDLQQINGQTWRANMLRMEDFQRHHQTLIKIENRILSRDYVPAYIFSAQWLTGNQHITQIHRLLADTELPE